MVGASAMLGGVIGAAGIGAVLVAATPRWRWRSAAAPAALFSWSWWRQRVRPADHRTEASSTVPDLGHYDTLQMPMLVVDREGRIVDLNSAFTHQTGHRSADLAGRELQELLSHRHHDDAADTDQLWDSACTQGRWQGKAWLRKRDGRAFPAWLTLNTWPASDAAGPGHFIVVVSDISAIGEREDRLRQLAFHDALTGLPNRRLFTRDLARAVERAKRHGSGVALMFLDLDHFKWINDSHGHAVGDRVLAEVGARLRQVVRAEDAVARLGGDEFTLLLEDMSSRHDAARMARKVIAALGRAVQVDGQVISISASIGIAMFPECGLAAPELMRAADVAMYRAKRYGRCTFAFSQAPAGHAQGPSGATAAARAAPLGAQGERDHE